MRACAAALGVALLISVFPIAASTLRHPSTESVVSVGAADSCGSARVIPSAPFVEAIDTSDATADAGDPTNCYGKARSVWYQFTPTATASYVIATAGSSYNARLGVYTGSCGALTPVGSTSCATSLTRTLNAGTTYRIMVVSGFDNAALGGILVLRVCVPPPSPTITVGTVCAGTADNIASIADPGPGVSIEWGLAGGSITSGQGTPSVSFTANPPNPFLSSLSLSVTLRKVDGCPVTVKKTVYVGGGELGVPVAVAPNSAGNIARLTQESANWSITNGFITTDPATSVGSVTFTAGSSGSVELGALVGAAPGCSGTRTYAASIPIQPITATTDTCGTALTIPSLPATDVQDLASATFDAATDKVASCLASVAHTIWYQYTPDADGPFTVHTVGTSRNTTGSGTDTVLAVHTGACEALSLAGCNFDLNHTAAFINQSAVTIEGVRGTTYRVLVGFEMDQFTSLYEQTKVRTTFYPGRIGSASITAPAAGCAGTLVTASVPDAGAGARYFWGAALGASMTSGQGTTSARYFLDGSAPVATIGIYILSSSGTLSYGTASITVNGSAAIAAPDVVEASGSVLASVLNTPGATYSWTIQNGSITSATNQAAISFVGGTSGMTRLAVTVTTPDCGARSAIRDVAIVPASTLDSCTFDLSPPVATFGPGGGSGSFVVMAPAECSWSATAAAGGFVAVTGGGSGSGNGTVEYSVAPNAASASSSTAARTAAIVVRGKKFTVSQGVNGTALVLNATVTPAQVALSWNALQGATAYSVVRASQSRGFSAVALVTGTSFVDTSVTPGTAYVYEVQAYATPDLAAYSNFVLAVPFSFSDPALASGMLIRSPHFMELRAMVDAARAALGWSPAPFTGSAAAGQPITAAELTQLRSAIGTIRAAAGLPPLTLTDPEITPGVTPVRVQHVLELRQGLQ